MNLLGLFSQMTRNVQTDQVRATNVRLSEYQRYLRSYEGFSVRGVLNTNVVQDWKRLKFNFTQPVINLAAGWFASKPVSWEVVNDTKATSAAYAIWDRSGSDKTLLDSALLCCIYGDLVGLATADEMGASKIEFIDPSICSPVFEGSDYSKLCRVEIAYEEPDEDGSYVLRREMWGARGMEAYEGEDLVDSRSYEMLPAVWIRNSGIKGQPFGLSDVQPILDLVEEYDHLASKQTRIVDYYASPNIIFSGLQKGAASPEKGVGTVFYLPADAKAYFLEWAGSGPDVELQLTRIRNAIAEISQVPAVAFGQADSGLTSLSGVALQILYGPLVNKTHRKRASWGPSLEYLMWLCLRAEGFTCDRTAVNVRFSDATPVDGQSASATASAKVAGRISSRRRAMQDLGIENPDAELLRIVLEEKILQLSNAQVNIAADADRAAGTGAFGRYTRENPLEAAAAPDPASPGLGEVTSTNADDISELIDRFDALVKSEAQSFTTETEGKNS